MERSRAKGASGIDLGRLWADGLLLYQNEDYLQRIFSVQ